MASNCVLWKQLTEYCHVAHPPQAHVAADNGGRHSVDAVAGRPDGILPVIPQLVPAPQTNTSTSVVIGACAYLRLLRQGVYPEDATAGEDRCCREGAHSLLSVDESPHDVVAPHVCVLMRDFELFNGVGEQLLKVLEIVLSEDARLGDATIQRV